MNIWISYAIVAIVLLILELVYFKIADKCNIIDKPNERSSHKNIVLRAGGIIYVFGYGCMLHSLVSSTGRSCWASH